jgi:hypothetical protein
MSQVVALIELVKIVMGEDQEEALVEAMINLEDKSLKSIGVRWILQPTRSPQCIPRVTQRVIVDQLKLVIVSSVIKLMVRCLLHHSIPLFINSNQSPLSPLPLNHLTKQHQSLLSSPSHLRISNLLRHRPQTYFLFQRLHLPLLPLSRPLPSPFLLLLPLLLHLQRELVEPSSHLLLPLPNPPPLQLPLLQLLLSRSAT